MWLSANWIVGPALQVLFPGFVPPLADGFARIGASLQQTSTVSMGQMLTSVGTTMTTNVGGLTDYIAAGIVISLAAVVVRRLVRAGR